MGKGGDRSGAYRERSKLQGRLKLDNQTHEDALHLLADGTPKDEVVQLMDGKITVEEIDQLQASPLGARRFQYIQQNKARDEFEPSTPDECLRYVKQRLVKLSREGEDKIKIDALKALSRVAIDERENGTTTAPAKGDDAALKELREAFEGGRDESGTDRIPKSEA